MRVSQLFPKTLREAPRDSEGVNQELLVRAGFIRQLTFGLPLRAVVSRRSLKNGGIELKLRSEKESRIVPLTNAVSVIQEEIRKGLAESQW